MQTTQNNSIQRDKLTAFFEEFLLEHGGAYTLFGTKPLTIEDLCDCSEERLQEIHQYLAKHPEIEFIMVDRKLDEGWEEWKKMNRPFTLKNYILKEIELGEAHVVIFLNICKAIEIIDKYYYDFQQVVDHDFNTLELIRELQEEKLENWRKIFLNRTTLGILAGYGYHNARLFANKISDHLSIAKPSENNDPRMPAECVINNKPFRIPIFVMMDEEESKFLVQQYKYEREKIKQIYEGKDFLKITLNQLSR